MLAGGAALVAVGTLAGELGRLDLATASTRSLLSLLYLGIAGSLVGFTAYTYLLRVSTPAKVATYAYVNPVVAVLLGWAFAGETITGRTFVAAAVILAGVAIITVAGGVGGATARDASSLGGHADVRPRGEPALGEAADPEATGQARKRKIAFG
jgi:drug/metabolite transporter (DMT)-like permease